MSAHKPVVDAVIALGGGLMGWARPRTMEVTISLNGERVGWIENNVQRLVVTDGAAVGGDSARLTLVGYPDRLTEIPSRAHIRFAVDGLQLGAVLRVAALGWSDRNGTIDVTAEPVDHDAALHEPRDADWAGRPLSAIAARIADRSGLTAAVAAELRAVQPDERQIGESDLAFLRRVAGAAGGEVVVKDGHLVIIVAGEALSAGSPLPLAAIEIDTDDGDWWMTGRAGPPGPPLAAQAESFELNLTGPLTPTIKPFHPLRFSGNRAAFLGGRRFRVGDVNHAVSAFSAPTTVFRAVSTP